MTAIRGYGTAAVVALAITLFFSFTRVRVVSAAQESKPSETPTGNAENGKRVFNKIGCYECHGREGQGSTMGGPRIAPDPVPFDALARYVRQPTGAMPP